MYRISAESTLAVHYRGGQQLENWVRFLFSNYLFFPALTPASLILVPDLTSQGIFDTITPFLGKVQEYLTFYSM